ncbi:hypothetical protein OS493_016694 [Desmophyllum pertusum]|uniref:Uncharacterized protein n=1 Tax=Desmophyllum pertusum TaxID=174260 RepID=A0A9X0CXD0_9CNID|nr:hypothetical protein OS493_016694 [Desmophyllum pertusum]
MMFLAWASDFFETEENKGTSSRNLSRVKEKESKGPSEQRHESFDGSHSRKHKKERNLTKHLEESIEDNEVSSKTKRDSPKKKKDKQKHGVELTRVKKEPNFDANSQITAANGEQSSTRKIKKEKNQMQECDDVEHPMLTPREKRKKRKSEIKVKQEPGLKNTKMIIPAWASSFL